MRDRRSTAVFVPNPKLKLLDPCREAQRFWHYSYRTEQTYLEWIRTVQALLGHEARCLVSISHVSISKRAAFNKPTLPK